MEDLLEKVARCEDRRYQDWSESWKEKVHWRESCQSFLHITYGKLTIDDHAHGGSQTNRYVYLQNDWSLGTTPKW